MRLTVVAGVDRGRSAVATEGRFVIGSDPGSDLVLKDPMVAPSHASLEVSARGIAILNALTDDGSLGVNGEQVQGPTPLNGGEAIQVGGTVIWTSFREPRSAAESRQETVVTEQAETLWLVICSGPESGRWIEVRQTPFLIGRESESNLVLSDDRVSRRQASLEIGSRGRIVLRDLGSSNGTFVNGRRIKPPPGFAAQGEAVLTGNDLLQFGDTLVWVTRDEPSRAG